MPFVFFVAVVQIRKLAKNFDPQLRQIVEMRRDLRAAEPFVLELELTG